MLDGKTLLLHRYVYEQVHGPIPEGFVVHHRNHNKLDNRIENLEAMSRLEHSRHHNDRHPREKACAQCGEVFTPEATKRERAKTCSRECFSALAAAHKTKFDHEARQGMKRMKAEGATFKEIAERYGASLSRTYAIVREYKTE